MAQCHCYMLCVKSFMVCARTHSGVYTPTSRNNSFCLIHTTKNYYMFHIYIVFSNYSKCNNNTNLQYVKTCNSMIVWHMFIQDLQHEYGVKPASQKITSYWYSIQRFTCGKSNRHVHHSEEKYFKKFM